MENLRKQKFIVEFNKLKKTVGQCASVFFRIMMLTTPTFVKNVTLFGYFHSLPYQGKHH